MISATVDWGSVPDWVTASATGLGFLGALVLLRRQLVAYRAGEEDRRREHAVGVGAWVDLDNYANLVLHVRNDGRAPIYDCFVTLTFQGAKEGMIITRSFKSIPSNVTRDAPLGGHSLYPDHDPDVSLWFRDSAGQQWLREADGKLQELPDDWQPPSRLDVE